jgi:hypothetical protein
MNRLAVAGMTLALIAPSLARADAPGVTTLVYNFTYDSKQSMDVRDSANPAQDFGNPDTSLGNKGAPSAGNDPMQGSGISHYGGALGDKGTMTVQILGKKQADGGQVVTISEAGQQTRRAPQATCVVYGNTRVLCDPNKTVYTEEYTLLRFLGSNFVDPNQLDKNKHWEISQNSPAEDVTADYVISGSNNGAMQIAETRKIRPVNGGSLTTDVQTKIGYDSTKSIPTSVDEYVTQRHDTGVQGTSTTIYQTTLQLVSDSMAKT